MNVLNRAGVLERAPFSGGESVLQHLFAKLCRPGAEQNKGFGRRVGSLGECLASRNAHQLLPVACVWNSKLPSVSLPPLRNPKLFLHCVVTLAWLQGARLHLTRYQAGACWGPGTLKSAPGGLNRGSIASAALPALVDVWTHVALPYHTPADLQELISSTSCLFDVIFDPGSQKWFNCLTWASLLPSFSMSRSYMQLYSEIIISNSILE